MGKGRCEDADDKVIGHRTSTVFESEVFTTLIKTPPVLDTFLQLDSIHKLLLYCGAMYKEDELDGT
jgi:hypothetical protein